MKGRAITSEVYTEVKKLIKNHPRMSDAGIGRIVGLSTTTIYYVRHSESFREFKERRNALIRKSVNNQGCKQNHRFGIHTYIFHVIRMKTLDEKLTLRARTDKPYQVADGLSKRLKLNARKYVVLAEQEDL